MSNDVSLVDVNILLFNRARISGPVPNNTRPQVQVEGAHIVCHDSGALERLIAALEIALVRLRDMEEAERK